MSAYRQIHTKIWSDPWFQDLLPEEKLLFIYLFSNEHAALCGLYELSLKTMGFETGLRPDAITLALHRFGEAGKAFYEAPYVWVPNLRKYNESRSPKVAAKIASELAEIPDCNLKRAHQEYYLTDGRIATGAPSVPKLGIEPPSIPYQQESEIPVRNKNSTSQSGASPNAKSGRSGHGHPDTHPAVAIFRAETQRYPKKAVQPEIENIVGRHQDGLDLWTRVVHEWIAVGWNPTNVRGMLDCFNRKELPNIKVRAGVTEPKGMAALREARAELEARGG